MVVPTILPVLRGLNPAPGPLAVLQQTVLPFAAES